MCALPRFSCIILSAGNSVRMGSHKALLSFGDHNISFLEKIVQAYQHAGVSQIVVVVNKELKEILNGKGIGSTENVELVVNHNPEKRHFLSLKKGLSMVDADNLVFIQNIDNPFVHEGVLSIMMTASLKGDVIVPSFNGKSGHPVLLNQFVCKAAIDLDDINVRLDVFFQSFRKVKIEVNNDDIFVNVNTPDDYKRLFSQVPAK